MATDPPSIVMTFPAEALGILREARWSPEAKRTYEGFADGYLWDNEFPPSAIQACMRRDSWAFRVVIAYRASLIRGEPGEELRGAWDQLAREAPDWPGFRPERRSGKLKEQLEKDAARWLRYIKRVNRVLNGES